MQTSEEPPETRRGAVAVEVIQRGIEAPRRLRPAWTVLRLLAILLLAGADVALYRLAAQGNGPPLETGGPLAVPVTAGVNVDAGEAG
jgi:hypothetical protein